MGRFPWKDVKKAVFFGLVIWFSTWVKSWSWIRCLHEKHGWSEAQTALLATVIAAVIGFLLFSVLFARPVLSVRWVRRDGGSLEEHPGEKMSVPKNGPSRFAVLIGLTSESSLGELAIRSVKGLGMLPSITLASPEYVRMVAERGRATTIQPGADGVSGVRGSWEPSHARGTLRCSAEVEFPVEPQHLVSSTPNVLKYSIRLTPVAAKHSSWGKRMICNLLTRFVDVDTKVTSIFVE